MKRLTREQVMLLHRDIIAASGGSAEVREEGLLDSAVNTPFQTFGDAELYPTLMEKAARLGFGIIKNHPFVDGNKRTGLHAMLVFLALNRIEPEYEDGDITGLIMGLAAGEYDESYLLSWLLSHTEEKDHV